ncbi:MAG: hypothetical protein R2707_03415 [Acidimicrobiales bacterium]
MTTSHTPRTDDLQLEIDRLVERAVSARHVHSLVLAVRNDNGLTAAAFDAAGRLARVSRVPSRLVRAFGRLISPINPNAGANLQMFALMGQRDMIGDPVGAHHLTDEFRARATHSRRAHSRSRGGADPRAGVTSNRRRRET